MVSMTTCQALDFLSVWMHAVLCVTNAFQVCNARNH